MAKTIIECMYKITEKMRDPSRPDQIQITPLTTKRAASEIRLLKGMLGLETMQVLILTAVVQKSSRYRIDGDDVSSFLGMEYLKFLMHDSDLEELRRKGYIRKDNEGHISIPSDVMKQLKANRPVEPEPTTGLSTGKILSRLRKLMEIRDDEEMTTFELRDEIVNLMKDNPETSISKVHRKYLTDLHYRELVYFYVMVHAYWFNDDDMITWHDIDAYFDRGN